MKDLNSNPIIIGDMIVFTTNSLSGYLGIGMVVGIGTTNIVVKVEKSSIPSEVVEGSTITMGQLGSGGIDRRNFPDSDLDTVLVIGR